MILGIVQLPELLGLSPNSTEAAIFTNATAAAPGASTTQATIGTGTSQSQSTTPSSANKLGSHLAALVALPMAIVFFAFSAKS